jgi:hypothetical protein
MIDFNHRSPNERINHLIDVGMTRVRGEEKPRDYLGGSRLGHPCERALQFEFFNTPVDSGKEFSGQTLRIFDVGHVLEDLAIKWLRQAGFHLLTRKPDGGQFEFVTANGLIKMHLDGVLVGGPDGIPYPALWECKSMKDKKWKACVKEGVAKSHPVYFSQIQVYQAYSNLMENPAILTCINKDTQELHHEAVPFSPQHAQEISDKGARIIMACQAGDLLPRIANQPDHFECKWCSYTEWCWSLPR